MSKMLDKLKAMATPSYSGSPRAAPSAVSIALPQTGAKQRRSVRDMVSRGSVEWSPDLARIAALPRRTKPDLEGIAKRLTMQLKRPEGEQELRLIQAWALWEAPKAGGMLAPVGVGEGKSLITCLMPMVMPSCQRAVLFIPPSVRPQFLTRDWETYGRHWKLPNLAGGTQFIPGRPVLHVVAYSELSSPRSSNLLNEVKPDLIIADEAHSLRYKDTARTRRFLRYFADHPDTRFVALSGTMSSKSIIDYTHLSALALAEKSPVPIHVPTVEEWAAALDPSDNPYDMGKLSIFCEKGEDVRSGFRRRLVDTVGVVATDEGTLGTSLVFSERDPGKVPEAIMDALRGLRRAPTAGGWKRPDGEELVDAMSVYACARQLACGFFYRWKFPHGESEALIEDWFSKRQAWNKELRVKLTTARIHLDSPALCENAARRWYEGGCPGCERGPQEYHARGCKEADSHPLWESQAWLAWADIEDKVYHEQEAVWLSDYLLDDVVKWMDGAPGIVWVEHAEVGRRLAVKSRRPYYGGGSEASLHIINEPGNRAVIASMRAHSVGKNLQTAFWRNLVVSVPSDAALLEQVIGRTHRTMQPKDEVEVHLYRHTAEMADALASARMKARYIQDTLGTHQRLVYGTWTF